MNLTKYVCIAQRSSEELTNPTELIQRYLRCDRREDSFLITASSFPRKKNKCIRFWLPYTRFSSISNEHSSPHQMQYEDFSVSTRRPPAPCANLHLVPLKNHSWMKIHILLIFFALHSGRTAIELMAFNVININRRPLSSDIFMLRLYSYIIRPNVHIITACVCIAFCISTDKKNVILCARSYEHYVP